MNRTRWEVHLLLACGCLQEVDLMNPATKVQETLCENRKHGVQMVEDRQLIGPVTYGRYG